MFGALRKLVRDTHVRLSFTHLHGPRHLDLTDEDVVAVCLIKDGAYFLPKFLSHHLALGIKHIVLVDNGSTDDTLRIARQHPQVSVVQSLLKASVYESDMRRYGALQFAKGHWCLIVDTDELFDYPGSEDIPLASFIRYLNQQGYTGALGHMLDLMPDPAQPRDADYEQAYRYYELDGIDKQPYEAMRVDYSNYVASNVPGEGSEFYFGGVRKTRFGIPCCLTKHPLVRLLQGVTPSVHPHWAAGVKLADVNVLLRHYKFAGDFEARTQKNLRENTWAHGEDAAYSRAFGKGDLFALNEHSHAYRSPRELVSAGFLQASERYLAWVDRATAQAPAQVV